MKSGLLYGIGLGPGDPELLTLKALRVLRSAAVVAYPAPDSGDSFARGIVAQWLDRGQPEIAIRFPMRPGPPPQEIYREAAAQIEAVSRAGDDVAYLCAGDPLLDQHRHEPLAQQARDGVEGVGRELVGATGAEGAGARRSVGEEAVQGLELEPQLLARLLGPVERAFGAGEPPAIEQMYRRAGGNAAEDGGPDDREGRVHERVLPAARARVRCSIARSARSEMIAVTRKSFGV